MKTQRSFAMVCFILTATFALFSAALSLSSTAEAALSGAIYTTDIACNGTNVNIFSAKEEVYLNGGPAHEGAAGLPEGDYYVQVTTPNDILLGTSLGSGNQTPVHVNAMGSFDQCYQLSAILIKASDGTPGYDNTTNTGGEYKVWVSKDPSFPGSANKTDNFKVHNGGGGEPSQATLNVIKFYDANVNGQNDDNQPITGWLIHITDSVTYDRYTPVSIILAPDDYTVTEAESIGAAKWVPTTNTSVLVTLNDGDNTTVEFGNVCLGAGGGLTLGFWSNKKGQSLIGTDDLAALAALHLRNANGNDYDPATKLGLRSWLLNATATNMAYMLSAQLASMDLNIRHGFVSGSAMVYAPGLLPYAPIPGLTDKGFISISDLIALSDAELLEHGLAMSGDAWRAYQEALKNALDDANNNRNFVQATPCGFLFTE